MALADYLDKGASLGPDEPCLVMGDTVLTYRQVQDLGDAVAGALHRSGIRAGDKVAILSGNDATAFACVFGISRAGAVWCPINPRNQAGENRDQLDLFDCGCLIFASAYAELVESIRGELPRLATLVCVDQRIGEIPSLAEWLAEAATVGPTVAASAHRDDDVVMLVGTGGTTGRPKGVVLTDRNLEAMTAITLMSYPFQGRPTYLAMAPLTHAAGVLCFPILSLGGRIVVMPRPDIGEFLALTERHAVTHAFLPPTLIYMLLDHAGLDATDLTSLQCFWYGAAPMAPARLEEAITRIGPVMGQLFGQSEAPMMVSTMAPADHLRPDGSIAVERLASAGRPSPLVTVGIMDAGSHLVSQGERGEIVVRGSLVMAGYYKNPEATEAASGGGWHHTGDVGYLDPDGYLFIVDRLKDMVITGGFNVYSVEVEQALMQHPAVRDCAVVGLPDDKWGERVTAIIEAHDGATVDPVELVDFVKARIGSVKAPKQIEVWPALPRSTVGKVLKADIKARLQA